MGMSGPGRGGEAHGGAQGAQLQPLAAAIAPLGDTAPAHAAAGGESDGGGGSSAGAAGRAAEHYGDGGDGGAEGDGDGGEEGGQRKRRGPPHQLCRADGAPRDDAAGPEGRPARPAAAHTQPRGARPARAGPRGQLDAQPCWSWSAADAARPARP